MKKEMGKVEDTEWQRQDELLDLEIQEHIMKEQHQQIMNEFNVLRMNVTRAMENQQQQLQGGQNIEGTAAVSREFIAELQERSCAGHCLSRTAKKNWTQRSCKL